MRPFPVLVRAQRDFISAHHLNTWYTAFTKYSPDPLSCTGQVANEAFGKRQQLCNQEHRDGLTNKFMRGKNFMLNSQDWQDQPGLDQD